MARVGYYGGAFNPPHLGHLKAAQHAASVLGLERLHILPAGQPPLKPSLRGATNANRLTLCEHTFKDPVFAIDPQELQRSGASYTIDTLRQSNAGGVLRPYWLIGSDQLAQFTQWHAWQEILNRAQVVVLCRSAEPVQTNLPVQCIAFDPLPIASTQIRRQRVLGQKSQHSLTPEAEAYANQQQLYSLQSYFPGDPARAAHSVCVAEAARTLAQIYGADPELAWRAGLLHDIAKPLPLPELQALCKAYGKPLSAEDLRTPRVCHAFAGEAYCAMALGERNEEVLQAVRWHTTGHKGMQLLEEIVYVADRIAADRTYNDIATVRALSQQSLHAASHHCLQHLHQTMQRRGARPHAASAAWYHEMEEWHERLNQSQADRANSR